VKYALGAEAVAGVFTPPRPRWSLAGQNEASRQGAVLDGKLRSCVKGRFDNDRAFQRPGVVIVEIVVVAYWSAQPFAGHLWRQSRVLGEVAVGRYADRGARASTIQQRKIPQVGADAVRDLRTSRGSVSQR